MIEEYTIPDSKELYIFGRFYPIQTKIGKLYFTKVKDYPKLMSLYPYIDIDKDYFAMMLKIDKNSFSFLDTIKSNELLKNLYLGLKKLFFFCFKEDVFDLINNDEDFEYYLNLIREINCIPHKKHSLDPEVEYFERLSQLAKERNGEIVTLKSMITSVWAYVDNPYELTIYELHALFDRISYLKQYDTTVLFKTVDPKINIVNWYLDNNVGLSQLSEKDKQMINQHLNNIKNGVKGGK